ncbi:MAG TPA: hypothetical protein VFQ61_03840 [Polyangiaceae bacterium]|nr:hypothetical protein [Polyangiaceae bacterium]
MATDDAQTRRSRDEEGRGAAPRKRKKGAKSAKLSRPLTEKEINVPDLQTLIMMGALGITALVMWAFARSGCNYHPPRETRVPRKVTTAELTREPRDAAIEFQHRLLTYDFAGAAEIAAGSAVQDVEREKIACGPDCAKKKAALVDPITSAVIVERTPFNAKVKVTTYRIPGGDKTFLNLAERSPGGWKITARVPDAPGATLPPPSMSPPDGHFGMTPNGPRFPITPPGASSAAPAGSAAAAPSSSAPAPTGNAGPAASAVKPKTVAPAAPAPSAR